MKLYTDAGNFQALKIFISAEIAKEKLEFQEVKHEARVVPYMSSHKLPVLEVYPEKFIFSSNAAARLILARSVTEENPSAVDQWLDWESACLLPAVFPYLQSVIVQGKMDESLVQGIQKFLAFLDGELKGKEMLTGSQLTVADVAVWSTLFPVFTGKSALPGYQSHFPILLTWFTKLANQGEFQRVSQAMCKGGDTSSLKGSLTIQPTPLRVAETANQKEAVQKQTSKAKEDTTQAAPEKIVASPEEIQAATLAWLKGKKLCPEPLKRVHPVLPEKGRRNILITSALPYVNNVPHLGNIIGCVLSADVFSRGDTSKWPVSKEVEDFLQKCDLHEDKRLEMFCNDHSQLCCTNCAFLNHRQCAKVTLISESVKGPPPDLQKVSKKIQTILETLKKLENDWSTNMQSSQVSYNKQLDEIRQTRQKINAILDKIEKNTIKELDDMMANLKASLKTDSDNCSKLKNELKQLSDAIHDIVDKGKAELAFIASKKCLEKIRQSETYLKVNAVQAERLVTFQADIDIEQLVSKLSGLGRIVISYPDQVFTVQVKSEYNVGIPSDSWNCYISDICVLSSNQILVADYNNYCVKLLDQQYKVVAHCALNAHPSNMCPITPNEVAVTVNKDKTHEGQMLVCGALDCEGRKKLATLATTNVSLLQQEHSLNHCGTIGTI
ncbi:hypothetical protein DPMN_177499 [Dreissena polymorpha]|uniref:Methionyl-tRNA synthetase n=1 Tax=Dreissena polymorpha TaxID=45954 RepID=A0A9D4EAC2_DREPO|nr:hypothetical protein DPMN_177499 [Dreissena polymorpha]